MKFGLSGLAAVIGLALLSVPTQSHATAVASFYGVWSDPVLAGNLRDGATGILSYYNNSGTAVDSITTTNTTGDTINWGTYTFPDPATGCAYLAANFGGTPCASTITFTGSPVPAVTDDPNNPFEFGTITYTNGTSDLNSLVFGATLTFYQPGIVDPIGTDFVQFVTTNNTGNAAQNADYISFSGLSGKSFNVYEGGTATGSLVGYIDDVVLTDLTIDQSQTGGFVGNSPRVPTQQVPEPASITLLGAAIAGLGFARRRRRLAA